MTRQPLPIAVLGSTGSVGTQSLDVIRKNPQLFRVTALSAGRNLDLLVEQVKEFSPATVAVVDDSEASRLSDRLISCGARGVRVLAGSAGTTSIAADPETHALVIAISGFAALDPVLQALASGKHLALANKECLVAGHEVFLQHHAASRSLVVPVDSEHNSIYQCLRRRGRQDEISRIVLTASGGPFFRLPADELERVTPEMAVRHPRWNMGAKISIDSATLMNKALEVIEASVLFGLPASQIEVLIHPESVVHGFVEYADGAVLAAMYEPDMRVPIAHALHEICAHVFSGDRSEEPRAPVRSGHAPLDLVAKDGLHFFAVDRERFPAIELAYKAIELGGGAGCVVNAANEVAVSAFMSRNLKFSEIVPVVGAALERYKNETAGCPELYDISDVRRVDSWGRQYASERIAGNTSRPESAPGALELHGRNQLVRP